MIYPINGVQKKIERRIGKVGILFFSQRKKKKRKKEEKRRHQLVEEPPHATALPKRHTLQFRYYQIHWRNLFYISRKIYEAVKITVCAYNTSFNLKRNGDNAIDYICCLRAWDSVTLATRPPFRIVQWRWGGECWVACQSPLYAKYMYGGYRGINATQPTHSITLL